MQGLDITLAHTTTATTAKTKNVSINLTVVIQHGGIARYGKVVIDMRLIDADALIARCGSWYTEEGTEEGFIRILKNIVDMMPTIEPERKKGRWIDETFKPWGLVHHPYKCDQCGEHSETNSNYCPNCGARMVQEGEDNERA